MTTLVSPDLFWLVEGLLAALVGGLVLALVVGALLVTTPRLVLEINRKASRWVDTRGAAALLEKPLMFERLFYRHHRVLGAAIALGAGYVLWRWAVAYERSAVVALLSRRWVAAGLDWIVAAVEVAVVALHVGILATGLVILARPSLLKSFEQTANRWHPGLSSDRLDAVIGSVDAGAAIYPRLFGLSLLAASLWSLAALVPLVL